MNLAGLHENVAEAAGAGSFPATGELKRGRGRPKKIDERFDGSKSSSTPSVVPKQYPCDWPHCGMWFTQSSNLNKHYLTHTDEKPFKCLWPNCDKSFKQSSNLNKHRLVHTGEKPFSCDYPECNKRFSQSSNLKKHKLVHSGDKPYRCEYPGCTKMFDQSSNLNKHFLTHVGQKPHVCSECGDKFSQSSNLTKHMRQRHGHYPGVQQSQPVLQSQQLAGSGNFLASNGETSATTPLANGIAISSSTASAMAVAAAAIEAGGGRLVVLPSPPVCYPNNVKNHQSQPHHQLMNDLTSGEVSNAVAVAANAFFSNATSQGKINFDGFDPKFISAHNFLPMTGASSHFPVLPGGGGGQSSLSQPSSRHRMNQEHGDDQQQQQQHYDDNQNTLDLDDGGGSAVDDPNRFLSLKLSIGDHDDS